MKRKLYDLPDPKGKSEDDEIQKTESQLTEVDEALLLGRLCSAWMNCPNKLRQAFMAVKDDLDEIFCE